MSKPYDASSKLLIDQHPRDWLALAGLPVPPSDGAVTIVDAELSTITAAADKLMLVENGADSYLAHIEFQASLDPALDQRVLLYNVLGGWRHRLPVRSVVFLLRPQAGSEKVRGRVQQSWAPDGRLDFSYRLIRVWELPVESLLTGPLGTLPLAPISAFPPEQLPTVVDRVRRRLVAQPPANRPREAWTATRLLMDLRYNPATLETLMLTLADFEQTDTYQQIFKKGVALGRAESRSEGQSEGRVQASRDLLVKLGTDRFGPPSAETLQQIQSLADPEGLANLALRLLHVDDWPSLFESK